MTDWSLPTLGKKLAHIREHVSNLWAARTEPPWYTLHNATHSEAVEKILGLLLPDKQQRQLTEDERFLLLAAAWLHDVGMILDLFGRDADYKTVRDKHEERSGQYIEANRGALGLEFQECGLLKEIVKFHRRKHNIMECSENTANVRVRLLAAYLRLADALHADRTRTDEARYSLMTAIGMPWEARFHWLKSIWIADVRPDLSEMKVRIEVCNVKPKSERMDQLMQLVADEIRQELESVKDVLVKGRLSCFLEVEPVLCGITISESQYAVELEELLGNIELENLNSATRITDSIIRTIVGIVDRVSDPYAVIRDYASHLSNVLDLRPAHVQLREVVELLKRETDKKDITEAERQGHVETIRAEMQMRAIALSENVKTIAENVKPFLLDAGGILLSGYSSIVIAALNALPEGIKVATDVFVAECRSKTQYRNSNELKYSDGYEYARDIASNGFKKVRLIPDNCVANILSRRLAHKVLLGTNGIGLDGASGNTAGHLSVVTLACEYDVPVFVLSDTSKIGEMKFNETLERDIMWFSANQDLLRKLRERDVRLYNPREDIVPLELITFLVTERGATYMRGRASGAELARLRSN